MPRKGTLPPGVKLEIEHQRGGHRCLFVKAAKEGKKYGEQCKQRCVPGRPRCRFHGGYAGRPPTTHAHSKYQPVPKGLQEKFERALENKELLNLWNKIALLDAQIWNVAEKAQKQPDFEPRQLRKLLSLMKNQRALIQQETERRKALGSTLAIEQVLIMIRFIYDSIARNVPDKGSQARIAADIRKMMEGAGAEPGVVQDAMAVQVRK
jgi:hypothetical protein